MYFAEEDRRIQMTSQNSDAQHELIYNECCSITDIMMGSLLPIRYAILFSC